MEKKDEAKENCLYFDISKQERDSAIRYLLGSIINCRREHNLPSNFYTFDEDVNVYLAHLLFAVSLPEYHEMSEPYLSQDSSEILKWVQSTEDRTIRYFIFKVNADHILLHTAIFEDLLHKPQSKLFTRSGKYFRELAQLYYEQAALYHSRIYRKKTGVGDVLEKIARYFDMYQGLLRYVRREYFGFMTSFRDQAFGQFMNQVRTYESEYVKKSKMDEFLDLYHRWRLTKNPELKKEIERLVAEIQSVDSSFNFNPERELDGGPDHERKCA